MTEDVFFDLIQDTAAGMTLAAQSFLFCSKDKDALMLLTRHLIKKENNGKENSADIILLPDGAKILVADIEKITSTALITPLELDYKYYILQNGETMNDSAGGKLLKTLEEPPEKVKIIILAADEYSVLPTVRSRCQILNLPPFSDSKIDQAIDGQYQQLDAHVRDRIKALSLGSITRAKKAAEGGYDAIEDAVISVLTGMKTSKDQARYSQIINKQKGNLEDIIDFFELVLSDTLRLHAKSSLRLSYITEKIAEIAAFYLPATVIRLKTVFDRARARITFSGNAASIIDEFLFSLLEVRQKCQS